MKVKVHRLICGLLCCVSVLAPMNVFAAEKTEGNSILFEERITQAEKQFNLEADNEDGTQGSQRTPVSLGASACAGSVCVGSACFYSVCVGSACTQSGCVGSGCVNSGCGGSVCIGSFCKSACLGSC